MSQLSRLWEYQQAELELAKLNKEIKSSQAHQKRSKLHKLLVEQQDIIKGYDAEIGEHTTLVASMRAQLEALLHDYDLESSELEIMQNDEETTVEELTESKKAIEKLVGRINSLNRELSSLIAWCDTIEESVNKTFSKAMRAKRDYDVIRTVCDEEREAFAPRIEALNKDLEEKRKDIPEELLREYNDLKKNYLTPIAKLVNNQCSGCYMELPSSVQKKVANENNIVRCENCGRILFIQ